MKVNFNKEPDMWPEEFTDLFSFDTNATPAQVEECISGAVRRVNSNSHYKQLNSHQFVSNDQIFVEELGDSAYGCELIFQHTHIPKSFGETEAFNKAFDAVFAKGEYPAPDISTPEIATP